MLDDKTFVCGIGAQKAGTSFLANYFLRHSEFMMSDLKELHYFDAKYLPRLSGNFEVKFNNYISNLVQRLSLGQSINSKLLVALIKRIEASNKNDYKSYFEYYIRDNHLAFGEITPAYSMLNGGHFKKIVSMFPRHKFIFLLRNPADRYWSQINYEIQSKKNNLNPIAIINESFKRKDYKLRSDYQRTIEELSSVVDHENICIEFYENIFSKSRGKATMEKISNFVGITFNENLLNQNEKINTTNYKEVMDDELRQKIVKELSSTYKFILETYRDVPQSYIEDTVKYLKD